MTTPVHAQCSMVPFCCGEGRWMIDGYATVFGVAYDVCPGSNILQKVAYLEKSTPQQLLDLLKGPNSKDKCFACNLEVGDVLAIPPT